MKHFKKSTINYSVLFSGGGIGYNLLEILWRGHTHISMTILGGFLFCVLTILSTTRFCMFSKCIFGGVFITAGELLTGCIVNLWLRLDVWDYSQEFCHFRGQICLRFFFLWCALCAMIIPLCKIIHAKLPLAVNFVLEHFPGKSKVVYDNTAALQKSKAR